MAHFFAELLLDLVVTLIGNWLRKVAVAICTWLDTKIHDRASRFVLGGLLGLAAYILIPVLAGLLGF